MLLIALIVISPLAEVTVVTTSPVAFLSTVRSILPVLVLLTVRVVVLTLALIPDFAVRFVVLAVTKPCLR